MNCVASVARRSGTLHFRMRNIEMHCSSSVSTIVSAEAAQKFMSYQSTKLMTRYAETDAVEPAPRSKPPQA